MPEMKTLPLLPLRGMMVFPYMIIHLDVGRERSMAALEQAMVEDRKIMLSAQIDADTDLPVREDLYEVGTVAEVRQLIKLPGGTIRVLVEGEKRARIITYPSRSSMMKSRSRSTRTRSTPRCRWRP